MIVMVSITLRLGLLLGLIAVVVMGQSDVRRYKVRGTLSDLAGRVVPAMPVSVSSSQTSDAKIFATDINGDFSVELESGDYALELPEIKDNSFKVFLRITENGPNPDQLTLITKLGELCSASKYPAVLKRGTPPVYPAAARAVGAHGTVIVMLDIGADGKAKVAKAVTGHPLLRPASEKSASQYEFSPPEPGNETRIIFRFIYLRDWIEPKEIERYDCPFRIVVSARPPIINT